MKVLDLDKFIPEQSKIHLGGKEFDITLVPLGVTLQAYEVIPVMSKIEKSESITDEDLEKLMSVIYKVLKVSDESITLEWLTRHIDFTRFNEIMPFIFDAIFSLKKKVEKEEEADLFTSAESSTVSAENTDGNQITS